MKSLGGVIALPDGSTVKGVVTFTDRITALEASATAGDDYILPGLIDLQVNGSHGIDVMRASATELAALALHLAREGTTAFLPTAVTAPMERIERAYAAIAEARDNDAAPGAAAILGMHLEGPFISPLRLGAHPPLNLEPRGEPLERVLAMRALRIVTLAPELAGATDAIAKLVARGVVVSIGHTNATLEEARAGIDAGARMFTHLFNAMRPLGHRDPGVIAAALAPSPALAAVIPDGVHVHPEVLAIAYRSRGPHGMILTTDKVALAATVAGTADTVGRARARVERGAARLADGTLAGSVISMLDGVRLMGDQVDRIGVGIGAMALMAATNPARLIGANDRGRIEVGARADLIVLDRRLKLKTVLIAGRELQ
ncbi:MAG TPA: N-acetylglucosamine-6-phosphate deacetylase [Candidatus Binataceae bacterium]